MPKPKVPPNLQPDKPVPFVLLDEAEIRGVLWTDGEAKGEPCVTLDLFVKSPAGELGRVPQIRMAIVQAEQFATALLTALRWAAGGTEPKAPDGPIQ